MPLRNFLRFVCLCLHALSQTKRTVLTVPHWCICVSFNKHEPKCVCVSLPSGGGGSAGFIPTQPLLVRPQCKLSPLLVHPGLLTAENLALCFLTTEILRQPSWTTDKTE